MHPSRENRLRMDAHVCKHVEGKVCGDRCCCCVNLAPNVRGCSGLFARGSQIPTQGWQLGLCGENDVGWVFGVGTVATAGMMQELKMQTLGVWSLMVMLQNISLSRITASMRTVRLGNGDFNQRIFTDVWMLETGILWPLFKFVVKYGMYKSLSWSFPKMDEETSTLIIHYCVSFQLRI